MATLLDLAQGAAPWPSAVPTPRRRRTAASRLVARLYRHASVPLRARLLGCLMRPLGTLGAASVAAGAFVVFVQPLRSGDPTIDPEAVARVSPRQVHELARFVAQVDPSALRHFAGLVWGSPVGQAPLGASALRLLEQALQHPA